MGLHGVDITLSYIRTYRSAHFDGRPGGGKTSLAFMFAHELLKRKLVRYCLSNVDNVWNDRPEDVVLREGRFVDAVFVLDEGGLYLKMGRDTEAFLAFMRKLNIIVLVPSVELPHASLRKVVIERAWNAQMIGVPAWQYKSHLTRGVNRGQATDFWWWQPSKIFGTYDTNGFPADDAGLQDWIITWSRQAAASLGYDLTRTRRYGGSGAVDDGVSEVDGFGGIAEEFAQAAQTLSDASLSVPRKRSGWRRRR